MSHISWNRLVGSGRFEISVILPQSLMPSVCIMQMLARGCFSAGPPSQESLALCLALAFGMMNSCVLLEAKALC